MNRQIFYSIICFFIFTLITFFLLLFMKFDKQTQTIIFKNNQSSYIYLTNNQYKQLNNYQTITIVNKTNISKEYNLINTFCNEYGYFLSINNYTSEKQMESIIIKLKPTNLFGI